MRVSVMVMVMVVVEVGAVAVTVVHELVAQHDGALGEAAPAEAAGVRPLARVHAPVPGEHAARGEPLAAVAAAQRLRAKRALRGGPTPRLFSRLFAQLIPLAPETTPFHSGSTERNKEVVQYRCNSECDVSFY
ncbi:unnamed protein product, partial [Iphiclides podalirius]